MVKEITLENVLQWKAQGVDFQLIDVREAVEHEAFNIGGTLIPLSDLMQQKNRLKLDVPVIFYCKRGIRSQIAIQKLHRFFPEGDFYNLKSGIGTQEEKE